MGILFDIFMRKTDEVIPRQKIRNAEDIIKMQNANKIRSLEVEQKYSQVRFRFTNNMKQGKLKRWNILKIRKYLEKNVNLYDKKAFKNDCHAIYTMLKAKDLTLANLIEVDKMLRWGRVSPFSFFNSFRFFVYGFKCSFPVLYF